MEVVSHTRSNGTSCRILEAKHLHHQFGCELNLLEDRRRNLCNAQLTSRNVRTVDYTRARKFIELDSASIGGTTQYSMEDRPLR
jgi:hypothetical protein